MLIYTIGDVITFGIFIFLIVGLIISILIVKISNWFERWSTRKPNDKEKK